MIATLVIMTPIMIITFYSQGFAYQKTITDIENEIQVLEQETRELEVKKDEKLAYSEIQEYAARDGLSANQDNVKRV